MNWRIDPGSGVVLHMHGVDHCISAERLFELLTTAPNVAAPWEVETVFDYPERAIRRDHVARIAADVHIVHVAHGPKKYGARALGTYREFATIEAAQAHADKVLTSAGWVLVGVGT